MKQYIFLFLFLLSGCGKDESVLENKTNSSVPDNLKEWVTDDVVCLTSNQKVHIIDSNEGVLYFDANTPTELLPTTGKIILENELSDKFPSGFYGKVAQVNKENDHFVVSTEWVPLSEAFTSLPDQTFDISSYITEFIQSDGEKAVVQEHYVINPITKGIESETKVNITLNGDGWSVGGSFDMKAKILFSGGDIHNFRVDLDYEIESELNVSFTKEVEFKKTATAKPLKKIGEFIIKAIPANVVVTPVIVVYAQLDGNGKVSLSASLTTNSRMKPYIQYNQGQLGCGLENPTWPLLNFKLNGIEMEAELNENIALAFQARLFNYENIRIELGTRLIFTEKAKFKLNNFDKALLQNGKAYASLNENELSCTFRACVYAEAVCNLITKKKEDSNDKDQEMEIEGSWEESIIPEKELLKRKLLPTFDDLNFDVQHKQHKATFSYQCSGYLFTESVQMGYALYDLDDENDQPIRMVLEDSYYVKSDMEVGKRMFTFEIENIEEEKNYYVRPLFKIYDKTMVSDDRAEYEILVGKWQVITQIDTYINNSDGNQVIYRCQHPGTFEFTSNKSGVQTGIHYGDVDNGTEDPDTDWHPEAKILFNWIRNDKQLMINIVRTEGIPINNVPQTIGALIGDITSEKLVFSYPINTIPEETAFRVITCKRIEE
ncbi:hypothetical protein [Bacteroides finegoldii]|uniref:hypothetical protein n=1 Tax=Bacteroides finegoldii TaxID=338188 RepID=UPI00189EB63F|nr:hypothetical protein [Bacteroides finegoldii]